MRPRGLPSYTGRRRTVTKPFEMVLTCYEGGGVFGLLGSAGAAGWFTLLQWWRMRGSRPLPYTGSWEAIAKHPAYAEDCLTVCKEASKLSWGNLAGCCHVPHWGERWRMRGKGGEPWLNPLGAW